MAAVILAIAVNDVFFDQSPTGNYLSRVEGLMLLGFLSLACGLILDTVTRGRKELKRMQYLNVRQSRTNG